ncbi:MAG: long-chain fatty acid--CoA ligase [Chloroflexota bacterium]|nr:long-chain fatty acid--CoA ligase [Chloroflexota bacterium]
MSEAQKRPWDAAWPAHVPRSLSYPSVPAWWLLEKNLPRYADRPAINFLDHASGASIQILTYGQLWELARRMAAALTQAGVQRGDRVAFYLPNSPELVAAFYGTWLAGGVGVPCSTMSTARELAHELEDSSSSVVLCAADLLPVVKPLGLRTICDFRHLPEPLPSPVDVDPTRDVALLLYTGGTTGLPKGAMLTHANIVVNTLQFVTWYDFAAGQETCISVLPLAHSGGMAGAMNVPLHAGASILLMQRFNACTVANAIATHRATRFFGVPTMYVAILNDEQARRADFSSLKACRTNAAPLPEAVKRAFDELAGRELLVEGYGLTEASPLTHANPLHRPKGGSIGIPLADTDARIVDDDGLDVPAGASGELMIRGPQVMKGYWRNPEETAAALKDAWLRTGDVARMDDDGYFYVVDRKKDCINTAGFKVWPREVEEVIYRHPAVHLVAVLGTPDEYRGEAVKACVVLKPGQQLEPEELRMFCREQLARYKIPRVVEFRDALPTSGAGKILRRELR